MSKPLRVLIVEDSENDALLLVRELRRGGFEPKFARVDTAEAMSAGLAHQTWDLVTSDYSMPHFSGTAALELLKQCGLDLPFIIVSGTIGEDVAVAAMKAGAHDYLMKGNLRRLNSAIERELREAQVRSQRRQAESEVKRNLERIKVLHEIGLAILSTLDIQKLLNILLDKIDPALATTIRLFNKETAELEPVACRNVNESEWKTMKRTGVQGLAKIVLDNRQPIAVSNIQTDPRSTASEFARKEGLVCYVGIPLIAKDEVLGLIAFYTRENHAFTDDEIEFLTTLAGQAAIGIHNARLYEQVKKQMAELEKSNKLKDEFLAVISHELRTPLNVSMGYTTVVKDRLLGEITSEQEAALQTALKHSHELLEMINSVLSVQALEADAVENQLEEIKLEKLLDELKAYYTMLSDGKISLLWDYPRDLPVIRSDQEKLKQVLQDLVGNAIKFTEKGSITLAVRHLSQANAVEFKVSDTGIGIPKEKLPDIFQMFRQLDSSTTRKYGGLGVGLFIVKKFTEMLGGTVTVESELDKGSTFTATIPVEVIISKHSAVTSGLGTLDRRESIGLKIPENLPGKD
jgi:signal transduction histidine kinase/FixJ family two-component response regulator